MVRIIRPENRSIARLTPASPPATKPVQVRPADQRAPRPQGNRRDNIGARHDAGVHQSAPGDADARPLIVIPAHAGITLTGTRLAVESDPSLRRATK